MVQVHQGQMVYNLLGKLSDCSEQKHKKELAVIVLNLKFA